MADREREMFDPEVTIPSVNSTDEFASYDQLRESFRIYPGEDGLKYKDFKLLGMGGMGVVYSAEDPTLERRVALKILREPYRNKCEQIAKFVNEARITAKIDHPNIVAVHQLGVNEQQGVYFSMRQISGETLQNALRRLNENDEEALREYTPQRLLDIFISGCNGVAAAHEKKILHCDLKPANIMIGAFGEVLVLDWGLAREFGSAALEKNSIDGTPAFMAPELITGKQSMPDEKTEVYALGTILYSILTWRQTPFNMQMPKERLLEKVAAGKYLPLKPPAGVRLQHELTAICRKAMALRREDRYATVKELLQDLRNFRDGYPVAAYSPSKIYRFFKLCSRHPAIPIAVTVAVITLAVHGLALRVLDYAQDRSLMRAIRINYRIANDYYRRSMIRSRMSDKTDAGDSMLKLVIRKKDAAMQAKLAIMEYVSIIDSSSGFSDAGQREFAGLYGSEIFRRMLILQTRYGTAEDLRNLLARCRKWAIFPEMVDRDEKLREMVRMIDDNTGLLKINSAGGNGGQRQLTITYPDDSQSTIHISGSQEFLLPAGRVYVETEDGLKMSFTIIPGRSESIDLAPPLPEKSRTALIPGDSFFMEIDDEGMIRFDLPEFVISRQPLDGEFDLEAARIKLEEINKNSEVTWRLPGALEIYKAWNYDQNGPQEDFYGVRSKSGRPVLLATGEFFDPATGRIVKNLTGGELYPVSSSRQAAYD